MNVSPTQLCPGCNYLSDAHTQYRGRLGWWHIRCAACGTVWSSWWILEKLFGLRVGRTLWTNPGNGITAAEMASLIALKQRIGAGDAR